MRSVSLPKEGLLIQREINRLETRLSGIRNMKRLPDMLFIVDLEREATATYEANIKGIPIVAMRIPIATPPLWIMSSLRMTMPSVL